MTRLNLAKHTILATLSLAALSLTPTLLGAQETPFHQRPGLWLVEMNMLGHAHSSKQCVSEASLAYQEKFGAGVRARNHCTANQFTHNADGSLSDTYTCTGVDGKRTVSHATYRGNPNSKFSTTLETGPNRQVFTSVFTYAGACPAGMRGGDMMMDGHVMKMMSKQP